GQQCVLNDGFTYQGASLSPPPPPPPACGDGFCNGGETTSSCPSDCPAQSILLQPSQSTTTFVGSTSGYGYSGVSVTCPTGQALVGFDTSGAIGQIRGECAPISSLPTSASVTGPQRFSTGTLTPRIWLSSSPSSYSSTMCSSGQVVVGISGRANS